MLQLTDRAVSQIKTIMQAKNLAIDNVYLRVAIKGGKCAGYSYVLDFQQHEPDQYDILLEQNGIRVLIDKKSEFFLKETTLDYEIDDLSNLGWVWRNEAASGTCGCGLSFSF